MGDIFTLENKIKRMIDDLKGLCATNGLSNQASEEVIITTIFLYKFLNDKFMTNLKAFADEMKMRLQGTEIEITRMLDFLRSEKGSQILEISRPYKDRNAETYRVYITFR